MKAEGKSKKNDWANIKGSALPERKLLVSFSTLANHILFVFYQIPLKILPSHEVLPLYLLFGPNNYKGFSQFVKEKFPCCTFPFFKYFLFRPLCRGIYFQFTTQMDHKVHL
jgi:hypothetical protein